MAQPHCVVYRDGTAHPTDAPLDAALGDARRDGGMLWVALTAPSPDEVREVAATLGLERLGVATALRTLVMSMAATHTPEQVQFYCLDFGGGSLAARGARVPSGGRSRNPASRRGSSGRG